MENLKVTQHISLDEITIKADFKHEQFIRHWVAQRQGEVSDCQYTQQVTMTVALPAPEIDGFIAMCLNQGIEIAKNK